MATTYEPVPTWGTTVTSTSYTAGSVPAVYDAFLYKPQSASGPLKLSIKLRINLRQLPPREIPLTLDADDKPFWTKPWTSGDWMRFVQGATRQANMWNGKFWLKPPSTFTEFDKKFDTFPRKVWRPYLACTLDVDFSVVDEAHRTIDVANLNSAMMTPGSAGPAAFRSHALLYDSLDVVPWAFPYGTGAGQPAVHYVIAHEIGHAIGLGHIGTLLKTPLCMMAIVNDSVGIKHPDTDGGRNSFYCYGWAQGAISGNIMGVGDKFTAENARPWQWAIMNMRGRTWEIWQILTSDPGEGFWADNPS